jgi:glycosyltransferase involved in cell wall biosynthesis
MKIAVLTNAYPPMKGGASRIAELQVGILEAAGHQVRVFRPETDWFRWPAPIRVFRHLVDLFSHRDMVDKIIGWHPDVLLTHNLTGCGFGTAGAVCRVKGEERRVRWVHVLHDVQLFEPSGRLRETEPVTYWQKVWSGMRRSFFRSPDAVISPTRWLLDQHKRRGWFDGVHTEVLANPAPEITFALRAPSDLLKLLFIGSSKEKGSELVDRIAKRTSMPVQRIASAPHEQIMDAIREADVLLLPSQIMENQPTVLLEAASVGLPVIASDVGGVRETLGDAGLVVPRDDEEAWVKAIESLRDPETYREQSTAMYELAKRHDPEAYAESFLRLIAE